ncbi:hypothetical protein RD055328_06140 [Companilactobacillus sp. RD055328]|uniref:magnesium transporter CorA family protein n=1 Tax=Companilactobacillus sp. RD055328 TaxID=2916634 RepID=UPI001FC812BC|nr:magnesium transporter CorA family protein [Companilactobacillus sp. RD055328]GKQ42691.1 hypothetical protein RD055328_06140 [Companilactobacillus sp. RD055328]
MISKYKVSNELNFISVNELTADDAEELFNDYKLTEEIIEYASDMKERPRIEYIEALKSWLIVFHVISNSPHIHQVTFPISVLLSDKQIILFTTSKTQYVERYFKELRENESNSVTSWGIYFDIDDKLSEDFIDKIEEISDRRSLIQQRLTSHKISDSEILELSKIQEEISYLLTAVNGNYIMLKEAQLFIKSSEMHGLITKKDREYVNDAVIEFEQIQKMVELLGDITDKLSNSFNNLLNNQTNFTMKILTIYSIILSIPTIISGFYGMNMFLPIAGKPWSWIFSLVLVGVGSIAIWYDLKRRHFM